MNDSNALTWNCWIRSQRLEVLTVERGQMLELAKIVSETVVAALTNSSKNTGKTSTPTLAFQKTEQILYNYYDFKKVVRERTAEEESIKSTVRMIELVDKGITALNTDPYYKVLEMLYFEGRTQEDIALEFKCSQVAISYHKKRLVKKLSVYLYPDQVVEDIANMN